jgi:hypothetical protein
VAHERISAQPHQFAHEDHHERFARAELFSITMTDEEAVVIVNRHDGEQSDDNAAAVLAGCAAFRSVRPFTSKASDLVDRWLRFQHKGKSLRLLSQNLHLDLLRSRARLHFQSFLLSWITHATRLLRVTGLVVMINSDALQGGLDWTSLETLNSWLDPHVTTVQDR